MPGLMAVGSKTKWALIQGGVGRCDGRNESGTSGNQIVDRVDHQWLAVHPLLSVLPTAIVAILLFPVSVVRVCGCAA